MNNKGKLEIEKKYSYEGDLEIKLRNLNPLEKDSLEIIDQYYDTDDYFLIRKDFWLRSRQIRKSEQLWELKYPADSSGDDESFSKYFESSDQQEIADILSNILSPSTKTKNLQDLFQILKLKIFASFKTTRKSFIVDEITIDLDQTDFGYKLAELEIVLDVDSSQDKIKQSIQKIKNLAFKLGIDEQEAASKPGKMFAYFLKFKPEIYAILLEQRNLKAFKMKQNKLLK